MGCLTTRFLGIVRRAQVGFTLTELSVVLVIISLLFVFLIPTGTAFRDNQSREITRLRMQTITTALVHFVAVNRRLPCPALGTEPSGTANAGIEGARTNGDCTNLQATGVVPWVALGLSQQDAEDGWYRRITYRAGFGLTRDNALDMTACDPAGAKLAPQTDTSGTAPPGGRCWATCVGTDLATCTAPSSYLAGKGFDIRDGNGNLILETAKFNGAAFVLISHGTNGIGAYTNGGQYISATPGTNEAYNINGSTVQVAAGVPATAATFRDEDIPSSSFDDIIVRPTLFSIIQRANLGPRSH